MAFSTAAITAEAQYRAIYTANQMRSETPVPTYIYVIGLGRFIDTASTEQFLATLANDGGYGGQWGNPLNSAQPEGLFLPVTDCPSATLYRELQPGIPDDCLKDSAAAVGIASAELGGTG